jgi:hypothetical protein
MTLPRPKELWEDFKAWRRGERRVRPYGTHGRIYERKDVGEVSGGVNKVKSEPEVTLHMKIIRADGTVEERTVPAKLRR